MSFDPLFTSWINKIVKEEKPGTKIIVYHFGIFESSLGSGYTIYLIGSKTYDPEDSDWACAPYDFEPREKYLPLPDKEFKGLEWEEVLEKMKKKIKEFTLTGDFKNSFLSRAKAITVGFDDGDLYQVK